MTGPVMPVRDEAALRADVARRSARLRRHFRLALATPTAVVAIVLVVATLTGGSRDEARLRVTDQDGDRTTLPAPQGDDVPSLSALPTGPAPSVTVTAPRRQPAAQTTTTTSAVGGATATTTSTAPAARVARMAFVRGSGVYEQRVDGSGLRRLASGALESTTWSPDGAALAFTEPGSVSGVRRVVVLDLATGEQRRLLDDVEVSSTDPAWSPDGTRLAVTRRPRVESGASGGEAAVWTIDVRTGEGRRVAAGSRPAWSPDGRLLFDCGDGLCTAPSDGSAVAVPGTDDLTDAAWSPDGAWLAAVDRNLRLVVLRPDGGGRRTHSIRVVDGPAWFPDGERIAFAIERTTTAQGIWSVTPDGGDRKQHTDGGNDRDPSLTSG